MQFREFEFRVRQYLQERGWDHLRPADLAKSIMIEGGELLEIFQWENRIPENLKEDAEKMTKIKKELADVMIYCFDMAVTLDLDVEEILNSKLDQVIQKYPVHLFNKEGNSGEPGTEDHYLAIKDHYRKEGKN